MRFLFTLLPLVFLTPLLAQDKKPPAKDPPRIIVSTPLGVTPGMPTKLTLRGLRLDQAADVRLEHPKGSARLLSKSKASVPNMQDANRVGDTHAEIEVVVPVGSPAVAAAVRIVAPDGISNSYLVLLNDAAEIVAEKEPNNGFRQGQAIQAPTVLDGAISQVHDVDVYRIEGKAGQRLECEVFAARRGSAFDPILSLYDGDGRELASVDDSADADPRLYITLPRDGTYFLVLQDAHDQGGPAHVYRFMVKQGLP